MRAILFAGAALAAILFMALGPVGEACNPYRLVTAANTNPTLIATGHRQVSGLAVTSNNTALYVHLYDTATAPTVGTTVPVQTYGVPAQVAGLTSYIPAFPLNFINGLGIGTSANVDGSGNVAANAVINVCWM